MTTPITATPTTAPAISIDRAAAVTLRHEYKHSIHYGEGRILSSRLCRLLKPDPFAGPDGTYRISSLYFDTPSDGALREKIQGVDRREKFRLRYYNQDPRFIRLEKKYKCNGLCGKRSARLTAEQVSAILAGDIGFLLHSPEPLLREFYSKLRGQLLIPKTVVTYDREAYCYGPGNVRVTIDRNLRVGEKTSEFLNPQMHHIPVSDGVCVLEVKYDTFLPDFIAKAVQLPGVRASSYCKYAVCRKYD